MASFLYLALVGLKWQPWNLCRTKKERKKGKKGPSKTKKVEKAIFSSIDQHLLQETAKENQMKQGSQIKPMQI